MKASEISNESTAIGAVTLTPSQNPAKRVAQTACWIRGCLNPATTFLSSAWYPDVQWIVCDECESTVDLTFGETCHESFVHGRKFWSLTKHSMTPSILGSSVSLFNGSRCFPLSSTHDKKILSTTPPCNFTKTSVKILNENAVCGSIGTSTWSQLEKILSLRKLASPRRNKKCDVEGCALNACSLWSTWKRSENFENAQMYRMYVCLDCQEKKFGGWPTLHSLLGKGYMTEEKLEIIASKCSKQQHPALPPALMKSLN